jgi:hypothetical protein
LKTAVNDLISEIKGISDYDISDTDLDTLLLNSINRSLKRIKGLLKDHGFIDDITKNASFKTIDSQAYVDVTQAMIVGDVAEFTGIVNDLLNVTIDGTLYEDIDISGDASIADVVASINAATGGSEASENGGGFLVIQSPTTGTGSTSNVTIADGTNTGQTVVGDLFSVAAERTHTGINDLDEMFRLSERTNRNEIEIVKFDDLISWQPDPTSAEAATPHQAARHFNRVYFRPTPSQSIFIYMEYYLLAVDLAAGGTMPFEDKFDPIFVAMGQLDLQRYLDNTNAIAIADLKGEIKDLIQSLIIGAAKNINMTDQAQSRRMQDEFFSPRRPTT